MLTNRLIRRVFLASGIVVLALVLRPPVASAQNPVTVKDGVQYLDWRTLPQNTVEGIAGESPCGWLIVETGEYSPYFSGRR